MNDSVPNPSESSSEKTGEHGATFFQCGLEEVADKTWE